MKKKIAICTLAALLIIAISIGGTYAWLAAKSATVENTFTVGNIYITLTESTGNTYSLVPGTSLSKDPRVTVKAGSEDCWLFFKLDKTGELDRFLSYAVAEGWTALDGQEGVYYRRVDALTMDETFPLLLSDTVTVRESVSEEMLSSLTANPTMKFTAYAIQQSGFSNPALAWQELNASL